MEKAKESALPEAEVVFPPQSAYNYVERTTKESAIPVAEAVYPPQSAYNHEQRATTPNGPPSPPEQAPPPPEQYYYSQAENPPSERHRLRIRLLIKVGVLLLVIVVAVTDRIRRSPLFAEFAKPAARKTISFSQPSSRNEPLARVIVDVVGISRVVPSITWEKGISRRTIRSSPWHS